ncbi:helix-turn-helix transcriptional regulator [Acidovorax sp. sic0104]|uniref:helix-turn-helix transcriptional regulator n=1 Tax=Acidovorax sp. sic0104 TaxID=2854784 RepID=UPI001C4783E6|nr:helix-turn-helix transcriptional regulator [Acidovorax sp. sic0104]MBV7541947.1 helix-turn-helix domain-containing protein [Acidovorax sp. sic0104]
MATAFQESLKAEIGRVARQHLKKELEQIRKNSTAHRSEIASLKREVSALKAEVKRLKKATSAPAALMVPPDDEAAAAKPMRSVSAQTLVTKRQALGLTQAQVASLVGVSSQTVYKWETGTVQPRSHQVQQIRQLLKLGKRAANNRLAAIASQR